MDSCGGPLVAYLVVALQKKLHEQSSPHAEAARPIRNAVFKNVRMKNSKSMRQEGDRNRGQRRCGEMSQLKFQTPSVESWASFG
jgi:hypothetical protein